MVSILRNNKGVALILTILIISLIVMLTVDFNRFMRSDLHAAVNLRDGIKLNYTAKSGFNYALAVLLEDSSQGDVDSLLEAWADIETLSKKNSSAPFEEGRFKVKVSDLSGRIQINNLVKKDGTNYDDAQKGLLTRFLKSYGIDDEEADNIVDNIKDWIDADDDPTGLRGRENSYYQGLDNPYSCKNAPIEFLEELLLINGITEELFYGTKNKPGLSDFISPYGDGKININTADPDVLRVLSDEIYENQEMVKNMIKYRNNEENNLNEINWDERVGMLGVNYNKGLLTTQSTFFEIVSEGQKIDSENKRRFEDKNYEEWVTVRQVKGMVKRTGEDIEILSWKIE